jgi:hypothetical protein
VRLEAQAPERVTAVDEDVVRVDPVEVAGDGLAHE